jgi:hyperosmotically inducible protein
MKKPNILICPAMAIMAMSTVLQVQAVDSNNQKSPSSDTSTSATQPDNTKNNERDREGNTLTPGDQSNTEADRKITQDIRKEIVKNDSLTTVAKNIKIITIDGNVTLRGPVNTAAEKAQIAEIAARVAPASKVDNQLEVKTQNSSQNQTTNNK